MKNQRMEGVENHHERQLENVVCEIPSLAERVKYLGKVKANLSHLKWGGVLALNYTRNIGGV